MVAQGGDREEVRKDEAGLVFMGTPSFAAVILKNLLAGGWKVLGVVTQPDRARGRGRRVSPSPVKEVALERGLPVLQPASLKEPGFGEALRHLAPDLVVTAAYGRILPQRVLSLPPLGCFNVHASLLPAYRGAAPIPWALLRGEQETGITIFRMDKGMDTGDVLLARPLTIRPGETAGELTGRLALLACEILPEALELLIRGRAALVPQDHARATDAPPLTKEQGRIDWGLPAREICNRIRAFDPWPGAFTFLQEKKLNLWEAEALPRAGTGSPGEILAAAADGLQVKTGDGVLRVLSLQIEGKKRMMVADFLRGHPVGVGEKLG